MAAEKRLDELVQSVTLYTNSHILFHGYVLPFVVLYVSWLYGWVTWYNLWEFYEGGLIGIAVIGCVQILVALFCHWSVHVNSFLTCRKEPDISKATVAKVIPTPNNGSAELVKLNLDDDGTYWFMFQKTKYIWQKHEGKFSGLSFPVNKKLSEYMDWRGYKDDCDIDTAERLYGKNVLEMEIPGFAELFRERATAPFFVFQVFCVALWCLDKYWYYSIFTLIMLILFECTLVQQQMRNMSEIRKMGNRPFTVQVYRGRRWRPLSTDKLIPGDLVSLSAARSSDTGSGGLVPCDVVLLRGGPCVVDESMLTGESVPQPKESLETRCCSDNPQEMAAHLDAEGPEDGRLHVLFGGTRLVQHAAPAKGSALRPPDNGCVVYVLRTGFSTSQGRLLRTILYGVKRVTANNRETFGFILFLLVFAIAAASYVWQKGIEDPTRNRYRLFLECTLILTSVVPPELPIELSLAVNTSLVALSKLGVYCTEPFRIPFAGKVDVCCFDKTGTLTSGELVVEGVALLTDKNRPAHVTPASDVPVETAQVLASCHSLARLSEGGNEDGLAGDPLEKVTLNAVGWNLTRSDAVVPKRGRAAAMKIFHRHHFTSALRRMCVVAGYSSQNTGGETEYVATVKGAPETLASMFENLPPNYEIAYMQLARRGARVLALGRKKLGRLGARDALKIPREQLETGLEFVGLLVISCPLKNDSRAAVREILHASHRVVMITGDGPLTACHVAKQIDIAYRPHILLSTREGDHWVWRSVDETIQFDLTAPEVTSGKNYDLCVTGDFWDEISNVSKDITKVLLHRACVYARFAPKQKEQILVGLKSLGKTTLMCGDGTNDVGALKHADVGVAILSGSGTVIEDDTTPTETIDHVKVPTRFNQDGFLTHQRHREPAAARQLRVLVQELEEQDRARVVRPGDASIASPFTSKLSSVLCICHVIKQGRCTLVTTLQMFKILALNALILAYSQSVLYLDGIRLRDGQATLQGLLLAACFLFVSRSRPLKTLSRRRPLPNIFNAYTILTVLLQFAVHFGCLVYVVREAKVRTPPEELAAVAASVALSEDEQDEMFRPNIVNSAVYVTSLALQVTTFAVNYRGTPFMESLMQNRLLLYSVLSSGLSVLVLVMGWLPELATHFELIEFAPDFRSVLLTVLIADVALSYLVDRACLWLFGEGRHHRD